MIRIRITPRHIDIRGHASLRWCTAVSTVANMLLADGRCVMSTDSATDRRNHSRYRRSDDALDAMAVGYLAQLALAAPEQISVTICGAAPARHRRGPRRASRARRGASR